MKLTTTKRLGKILTVGALVFLAAPAFAADIVTYFHLDALGSPVAATDQQGNVVWREDYEPYGNRIKNEAAAQSNTHWYTGHPHDQATGLTYMGARWYDPTLGRFMAVDPKDFTETNPHSFNRYAYANNNPYRYLDPNGQWSTDAHNYFIDQAFPGLSEATRGYIKEGSFQADLYNQLTNDHIHSMWKSGSSSEEMQMARAEYISERLQNFGELMTRMNDYRARGATGLAENFERRAWVEYGKALHPIMDSTSPVHNQEWNIQRDAKYHGNNSKTREDMSAAPFYRDETVQRMHNVPSFLSPQ